MPNRVSKEGWIMLTATKPEFTLAHAEGNLVLRDAELCGFLAGVFVLHDWHHIILSY